MSTDWTYYLGDTLYLYFVYLIKLWKLSQKTHNDKLNRLRKQTYCFIIFVMIVTIHWSWQSIDHHLYNFVITFLRKLLERVIRYLFMSDCISWNWGTLRLMTLHFVPNVEKMSNYSHLINMLHLGKKCVSNLTFKNTFLFNICEI